MQAGISDTCIYYSCNDHFSPAGKDSDHVQVECQSSDIDNATNLNGDARPNMEGRSLQSYAALMHCV